MRFNWEMRLYCLFWLSIILRQRVLFKESLAAWKNTRSELISVICCCCVSCASISPVSRHLARFSLRFSRHNPLFLRKPPGCSPITFIYFVGVRSADIYLTFQAKRVARKIPFWRCGTMELLLRERESVDQLSFNLYLLAIVLKGSCAKLHQNEVR